MQLEYFKINYHLFVNFDEPEIEVEKIPQSTELEFNKNLLRKVDELRTFCKINELFKK